MRKRSNDLWDRGRPARKLARSAKINRLRLKDCAPYGALRAGAPAVPANHLNAAYYLDATMAALNSNHTDALIRKCSKVIETCGESLSKL